MQEETFFLEICPIGLKINLENQQESDNLEMSNSLTTRIAFWAAGSEAA